MDTIDKQIVKVLERAWVGRWFKPPAEDNNPCILAPGKVVDCYEVAGVGIFPEGGGCCCHPSPPSIQLYLYRKIEGREGLFGVSYSGLDKIEWCAAPKKRKKAEADHA